MSRGSLPSARWWKYLEPLFMGLMLFGIVAMSQPFFFWLYSNGFTILFPSTLA